MLHNHALACAVLQKQNPGKFLLHDEDFADDGDIMHCATGAALKTEGKSPCIMSRGMKARLLAAMCAAW